ncbi:MAG: serine/threonine protein kinase, partial [Clostridia bacterium]|nr:serine/threonine protein kinase [Deltaproteobacteria bacterium]
MEASATDTTDEALVLGRYRLESRIASGGAGTVFAASDALSDDRVVVKYLDAADDTLAAFVRESRLALRLRHPGIVSCLNVGFDASSGLWLIVYERALGGSLRRILVQRPVMPISEVARLVAEVASALAYAHDQNVIHRDIKPENILAAETGDAAWMLTDFGAGRFLEDGTSSSSLVGSLAYMAPEALGRNAGAASDQYALGVVALEALLGKLPGRYEVLAFRAQHRDDHGPSGVIARMLAPSATDRFPHLAMAVRLMRRAEPKPFDAAALGDIGFLLDDDVVYRYVDGTPETLSRISGARRFERIDGEHVLLACPRRLTRLDSKHLHTLIAVQEPMRPWLATSVPTSLWATREQRLVLIDADGSEVADCVIPTTLHELMTPTAVRVGCSTPAGTVLLGVRGATKALHVRRDGLRLVPEVV